MGDRAGAQDLRWKTFETTLDRARSPSYGHVARYLTKLEALAVHKDERKSGFWSLVKENE
jgi:hypothetical protein